MSWEETKHKNTSNKRWIHSASFDLAFILSPPFLISALVVFCPDLANEAGQVPLWIWVVCVMGIDVSHVYSTLYRTYLDKQEFNQRRILYTSTPLMCWVVGILLYSFGSLVFWSTLAYLALFHFIRQQYGFMMLYSKKGEILPFWYTKIDTLAIYSATLYPILYWHTNPRNFVWLIDGDFLNFDSPVTTIIGEYFYITILLSYSLKEIYLFYTRGSINLPKNLLLLGTIIAWYVGIVAYNGDLAFTLTNVISHGVPYIALIWVYGRKKWFSAESTNNSALPFIAKVFSYSYLPLFIFSLITLSYFEEALWDILVWQEKGKLFGKFLSDSLIPNSATLGWIIPLLAVPQSTHYVLDAFIWKIKNSAKTLTEFSSNS